MARATTTLACVARATIGREYMAIAVTTLACLAIASTLAWKDGAGWALAWVPTATSTVACMAPAIKVLACMVTATQGIGVYGESKSLDQPGVYGKNQDWVGVDIHAW